MSSLQVRDYPEWTPSAALLQTQTARRDDDDEEDDDDDEGGGGNDEDDDDDDDVRAPPRWTARQLPPSGLFVCREMYTNRSIGRSIEDRSRSIEDRSIDL